MSVRLFFSMTAMLLGAWKLVREPRGEWQLFNILEDPSEAEDLAAAMPELRSELLDAFNEQAERSNFLQPANPVSFR